MSQYETALRMLNEHGEELTLTKQLTGGKIDQLTGEKEPGTVQTNSVYGIPISDTKTINKHFSGVTSSELVYMVDASQVIEPGLQLATNEDTYQILESKALRHKGQNIYYMVKLVK